MRLQPRGHEIPASEGRRQAQTAHWPCLDLRCLLPGTEVSFAEEVRQWAIVPWSSNLISYRTAIFKQVNKYLVLAQERRCLSHATARLGHRNVQHTVRYTDLAPDRSKDFWRR